MFINSISWTPGCTCAKFSPTLSLSLTVTSFIIGTFGMMMSACLSILLSLTHSPTLSHSLSLSFSLSLLHYLTTWSQSWFSHVSRLHYFTSSVLSNPVLITYQKYFMVDPYTYMYSIYVCVYRRTCISFGGGVLHAHTNARMHMSRPPNQPMKLVNIIVCGEFWYWGGSRNVSACTHARTHLYVMSHGVIHVHCVCVAVIRHVYMLFYLIKH